MAFNNIDQLNLGNLLQIVFSNGVRNQISQDYRDWEYVNRFRIGNTAARELRFMFQTNYGPSAIQYRDPGTSGRSFPNSQQSTISEKTAKFKEINATVELEYNMWDRARKSPEKYAEPLALEIQAKTTASKRRIAADLYGDGSGVVGQVESVDDTNIAAGEITVTLKSTNAALGHVGFFEYGDLITPHVTAGTAQLPTGSTDFGGYRVKTKDRDNNTVTLSLLTIAGAVSTAMTASNLADTDVFYRGSFGAVSGASRSGQPTIPNLDTFAGDYGTMTEVIAGLESLTAGDGRTIHGINMEGAEAGTRQSAGGNPLDVKWIQKALDAVKVNVGQDSYSWKMMCMSPEAHSSLIESRETDRRFQTVEDNKRGIKYFAYIHGNDVLETYTTEYCPKKRIYMLPEAKSSDKVLEFWGSDFETVKAQGMGDFHLKPSEFGGHVNNVISYLSSIGVLVCKHPASIATVEDFEIG